MLDSIGSPNPSQHLGRSAGTLAIDDSRPYWRIAGFLNPGIPAHMLGARRASVTVAADALKKAGLISCVRGELIIEDRQQLEKAWECYGALRRQLDAWRSESE